MKIYFIGGGNMAVSILNGLRDKKFLMSDICVAEINDKRRKEISETYKIKCTEKFISIDKEGVLILAVKPDQLSLVCSEIKNLIGGQLIISIAAGVQIKTISEYIGGNKNVIRAMPNLCAGIQKSITPYFSSNLLSDDQDKTIKAVLNSIGVCFSVDNESKLDAVTALSGSGPAYIFYIINALIKAGEGLGLSRLESQQLTQHTIIGAELFSRGLDSDGLNNLIKKVSSKGGTTEEALKVFENKGLNAIIEEAIIAAHKKSKEIGNK
jgi:pyrroline-5-carboxylate reductase